MQGPFFCMISATKGGANECTERRFIMRIRKLGLAIAAVVLCLIVLFGFTVVKEGQVGVKYRFGSVVNTDLEAGLHYHIPFVERIGKVDITEQVYATDTTAYTKDTQTVEDIRIKVNYRYDISKLSDIIKNTGISSRI